MYRFVAVLTEPLHPEADEIVQRVCAHLGSATKAVWKTSYSSARLTIWHAGERGGRMEAHALDNGLGVVLGQLFHKMESGSSSAPVGDLSGSDSAKCLEGSGRYLVENFWGRYVAFLDDREAGLTHVMRDPSAALPCYWIEHQSARIFFSDVADIMNIRGLRFSVNYDFIAANALLPQFQKAITGLNGVREILPAEAVSFDSAGGERHHSLWNPYEVANTDPIYDREAASRQLREVIIDATGALGRPYDTLITSVGGLDSSIVLSCLASSVIRTSITCLNMATPSPKGNESFYAGKAADHAGVPLRQGVLDPNLVDLSRMMSVDPQLSPMVMFDCTSPAGCVYDLAKEIGAEALFYGVGGDNVFFQVPYILSAIDYVSGGGGHLSLPRVAMEAAQYGNRSLAFTMWSMLREWVRPKPSFDFIYSLVSPANRWAYINPDLLQMGPDTRFLHPMLVPPPEAPKGKCAHVMASALLAIPYYDHWRPDYAIERVCPLLSQKVVELALRIPTWNMVCDGIDRGLARKSFARMLPPEVLHRTSKSKPDELYERVFELNRDFIREVMLDGELVRRHILDRPALERLLHGQAPASVGYGPALEFLSWEIWAQQWQNRV